MCSVSLLSKVSRIWVKLRGRHLRSFPGTQRIRDVTQELIHLEAMLVLLRYGLIPRCICDYLVAVLYHKSLLQSLNERFIVQRLIAASSIICSLQNPKSLAGEGLFRTSRATKRTSCSRYSHLISSFPNHRRQSSHRCYRLPYHYPSCVDLSHAPKE